MVVKPACVNAAIFVLLSAYIACLHDQNKSGFFGGPDFSSQSGLFENFSDCSDWLDKSRPFK